MPDISVVTPSYNQGRFIERTIRSVIEQQDVDVQYIVVDGNSTDETREILERYRDRIDTLIVEPDDGQADALAKGFRLATAPIVSWLNSDDVLLPRALSKVKTYFDNHPDVGMIYGHRTFIDEDDRVIRFWILPPHIRYCMERWDFIPQETCFWRHDAMDTVGGVDPGYKFAMDYDLFVRLMREVRCKRLNRRFAAFRQHPDAKTSREYATTGVAEVARVQERYRIESKPADPTIQRVFTYTMLLTSAVVFRAFNLLRSLPSA